MLRRLEKVQLVAVVTVTIRGHEKEDEFGERHRHNRSPSDGTTHHVRTLPTDGPRGRSLPGSSRPDGAGRRDATSCTQPRAGGTPMPTTEERLTLIHEQVVAAAAAVAADPGASP